VEDLTREAMRPLLELQRVDTAIARLKRRQAELPEQKALDDLETALRHARISLAERQVTFDQIARDQSRLEAEISTLDQKISHESERLYGGDIGNPKELASIQAEIDGLRRRKSHIEDQDLDLMEKREEAEKALDEAKAMVSRLEGEVSSATAARDSSSSEIASELSSHEAARAGIAPGLPEEVVELYDDLRQKKDGIGVAALEGGVCKGCNVKLSPMAVDGIKRSSEPIVRCENCRRLLVVLS
jgi:predicted  nucleic acid-binding Zn-ribbon protein